MVVIYKITSPSGKIYIGQTWNWTVREKSYRSLNCKSQKALYSSFIKYGFNAHNIDIVYELSNDVTQDELDKKELYYWSLYKESGSELLNCRYPGSRGKHTEETKQKMSEIRKKKGLSESQIQHIIAANKSDVEREKRRKALTGHVISEETKKRISDKIKEKWKSGEYSNRVKRITYGGKLLI
jgi:group I intron endonuclease